MNRPVLLTLALAATPALLAAQVPVSGGIMGGYAAGQPTATTGAPVSIAFERKTQQTLADGTHITHITHEWFYRDSQGRTRTEFELTTPVDAPTNHRSNVNVNDPVAGQSLSWLTGEGFPQTYNTVKQTFMPAAMPQAPTPDNAETNPGLRSAPPPQGPRIAPVTPPPAPTALPLRRIVTREKLGTQQVQGAPCQATRTVTIYPLGLIGNDRPITVLNETCMSREFNRALSETTDDPRTGIRTLTTTSFSRTEPDAALFKPPPTYTERPAINLNRPALTQ